MNPLFTIAQQAAAPPDSPLRAPTSEISKHIVEGKAAQQIQFDGIILAAGVILIIFAALSMWRWRKNRHEYSMPTAVFMRVGRDMGLTLRELLTIRKIAKSLQLGQPLAMLLSPGTMSQWTRLYTQNLRPNKQAKIQRTIQSAQAKLFGPPPPPAASPPASPAAHASSPG